MWRRSPVCAAYRPRCARLGRSWNDRDSAGLYQNVPALVVIAAPRDAMIASSSRTRATWTARGSLDLADCQNRAEPTPANFFVELARGDAAFARIQSRRAPAPAWHTACSLSQRTPVIPLSQKLTPMAHKHLSLQRRRPQQSSTRREPARGCGLRDPVGAPTESDLKGRKDAFDDAISATKPAVAEGIVRGGDVALLRPMDAVMAEEAKAEGDDRTGLRLLRQALTEPARQIASNSGIDLGVALEKIRSLTENVNLGLAAATGR